MSDVREAVDSLLADRPDLEDDLRTVLDVDAETDTWTFDDIPLDSGAFGELVSRGVVERADGEYRIADRDAVLRALDGEAPSTDDGATSVGPPAVLERVRTVDPVLLGSLLGLLGSVVLLRTVFSWGSVFRNGHVVLLGNDPYFYRYWIEELFRTNASLGELPAVVRTHDVLMIAVTWGVAALLGGGAHAVGVVLAWYPVVAAVVVGVLVYAVSVLVFDDRRVGLASVALYAVTPILAYRSAFGFGDHHAFDYVLVALAVAGLVALVDDRRDWRTVTTQRLAGAVALTVAVAGQVHAWRGGSLLVLPIAAYVVVRAASDVRAGDSPLRANAWTLAALLAAAVLAAVPHVVLGWAETYRAFTPALLFAGSLVTVAVGEAAHRRGLDARTVLGVEAGVALLIAVGAWFAVPAVGSAVSQGIAYFGRFGQSSITETYSLLSPEHGVITTPIFYFGFTFFLAIAALAWATWRVVRSHEPAVLAITVYGWAFFAAALVQLRFAGQLGILLSVFGGLAFVYLVAAVDVTEPPRPFADDEEAERTHWRSDARDEESASFSLPDRQALFAVGTLFLLVGGIGALLTAGGTGTIVIDDATYDAATAIDDHAASANATWPENYVFSSWDRNRVYNYVVNGHSRSYAYAQTYYSDFLASTNASEWYDRLSEKPVGYVVATPSDANYSANMMQTRLWANWGSRSGSVPGVGHYRAVYANDDRKVYELVPGAMVVGRGTPGEPQMASTEFTVNGETHTYERRVTVTQNGWYAVRVPYNGTYQTGNNSTQRVPEAAVENGTFTGTPSGGAHWPLNASRGDVAFDIQGGHHGLSQGANWVNTGSGTALAFDGNDTVRVPSGETLDVEGDFAFSVTFRTNESTDYVNDVPYPRLVDTAPPSGFPNTSGFQFALAKGRVLGAVGDGSNGIVLNGPRVDDGQWHTVRLVREDATVHLYLDGELVGEKQYSGPVAIRGDLAIGSMANGERGFVGEIRNVTVRG